MNDRKVKGKPVTYVPAGETFVAHDGETYKAVRDEITRNPCQQCDFRVARGVCGRYRCVCDDRADGVGVHFVRVKE